MVHDAFNVSLLKKIHVDKHWIQKTNIGKEVEVIPKQQVHLDPLPIMGYLEHKDTR